MRLPVAGQPRVGLLGGEEARRGRDATPPAEGDEAVGVCAQVAVPLGGFAEAAGDDDAVTARALDDLEAHLAWQTGTPADDLEQQKPPARNSAEAVAEEPDRQPGEPAALEEALAES